MCHTESIELDLSPHRADAILELSILFSVLFITRWVTKFGVLLKLENAKTSQSEMMIVFCVSLGRKPGSLEVQPRPTLQRSSSIADDMETELEREISLVPVTHVSQ